LEVEVVVQTPILMGLQAGLVAAQVLVVPAELAEPVQQAKDGQAE
jgi:hypothetical protein